MDVLGLEHDAHAAGADPINDAVAVHDQAMKGAGRDAIGLILRQELGFDEVLKKLVHTDFSLQFRANLRGRALPILAMNERALDQEIQKRKSVAALHEPRCAAGFYALGRNHASDQPQCGVRYSPRHLSGNTILSSRVYL